MVKDTKKMKLIAPLSGGIVVLALIVAALFSGQLGHASHAAHAAAANSCANFNPPASAFQGPIATIDPHFFVDTQGVTHPYIISGKVEQAFNGNTPCNIFRVEATVTPQPGAPAGAKITVAPVVRTYSIQHHNPPFPDGGDAHDPAASASGTNQTFIVGANPTFTQDSSAGTVPNGRSDVEADCEILITETNPDGTTSTYEGGFAVHVA